MSRLRVVGTLLALAPLVACGSTSPSPPRDAAPAPGTASAPGTATAPGPGGSASTAPAWSTGPVLPVGVSEVGVAVLDGQVHVLGGYVGGRAHSTTHLVYDPAARRWRRAAPLPVPLDHVGAAAVGTGGTGRVLAVGGYGAAGRPTREVWAYDPGTDRWSPRAPLPTARSAAATVVVGGLVHVLSGRGLQGDTTEHDVYDPSRDSWSVAAPVPTARDHAAAAAVGPVVYLVAGRPGGKRVLESLDTRTGRWTTGLPPLPLGRSSLAGAAWRGTFVVLGGEDAAERTAYRRVDAYDPRTRTWRRLPDLPGPRQGIGAAVVDDTLLVPGGGPSAGASAQTDTLLQLR